MHVLPVHVDANYFVFHLYHSCLFSKMIWESKSNCGAWNWVWSTHRTSAHIQPCLLNTDPNLSIHLSRETISRTQVSIIYAICLTCSIVKIQLQTLSWEPNFPPLLRPKQESDYLYLNIYVHSDSYPTVALWLPILATLIFLFLPFLTKLKMY